MTELGSEYLIKLIDTYGFAAVVIVVIISVLFRLITEHGPQALSRYQDRKANKQRYEQTINLANAGSQAYTEEQMSQHLSELYGEFQEVNKFVREGVAAKLIRIEAMLDHISHNTDDNTVMTKNLMEVITLVKALHNRFDEVTEVLNGGK